MSEDNLARIEDKNSVVFTLFKIFGIFLLSRNPTDGKYRVHRFRFFVYYSLWFLFPGISLVLIFTKNHHGIDITETSSTMTILLLCVISASLTLSLFWITKYMPDALFLISKTREIDVGFKISIHIHPVRRILRILSGNTNDEASDNEGRKYLHVIPMLTFFITVMLLISVIIFNILRNINLENLWSGTPIFAISMFFLPLPVLTNLFCVVFMEWLITAYEALESGLNFHCKTLKNNLESSQANCSRILTDKEKYVDICCILNYVDHLQAIFHCLSGNVFKSILSLNYFVYIVVSIICTSRLLEAQSEDVFFLIPLSISSANLYLSCYKSSYLMDTYMATLSILRRILQLSRENIDQKSWEKIKGVRDTLQEDPPQIMVFGGYSSGFGFFLTSVGFVVTYAAFTSDFMNSQTQPSSCNATLSEFTEH